MTAEEITALQAENAILKAQLTKVEQLYLILAERHDALVRLQQITSKHLNPTYAEPE